MLKKLLIVLFVSSCFACNKNQQQKTGCPTQVCTMLFASVGIKFTDKDGKSIAVSNYTVTNQRTHLPLTYIASPASDLTLDSYYTIANDNMRDQLSTEGDDLLISATNPTTNQTKTAIVKISGGCNCHVAKLSGPAIVAFD